MKKVLIYGIATYKNRGVEAIVNSSIKLLKDYDITIATYDYDENKNKYTDKVKYIRHKYDVEDLSEKEQALYKKLNDPREKEILLEKDVIEAIKDADICISAGGDNYTYGEEYYLYVLDEESKRQNKKLVFWGGSLFDEIKCESLISDMGLFDALIVRESITYEALKKHICQEKMICIPDPAFSLETKKVGIDDFYNSKVVGINFSPLTIPNAKVGDKRFDSVIKLINYILKETNYNVSLIPHVTTDNCNDLKTLNAIYDLYKGNKRVRLEEDKYDCSEIKYLISKCSMLIASRTHASIAAYSTNVPTLVIGYSVKSRGIAKDIFGTYKDYVVSADVLEGDKLINSFIWLDKNKKKIKSVLKERMSTMISSTNGMVDGMLNIIKHNEEREICNKKLCTGCGLCASVCKHGAITMQENSEGFLYPVIDSEKCTNCGLCKKKCPVLNSNDTNIFRKESFAAKNKSIKVQQSSTSGGIFNILANQILSEHGVVYGCEQNGTKVSHVRIDQAKDLSKISGTKYNQSNILNIYKDIENDIKNNKKVLFSGTACQVAAIKKYLNNNDNLITVSVICHGVMSTKILDKYIEYKENISGKKLENWKFRVKSENEWINSSVYYKLGSEENVVSFDKERLMELYINNYILRESCYSCMFKGDYNPADIIIGDAWGIQITNPKFYDRNGVSSIIINTEKGSKLFESSKVKSKAEIVNFNIKDIRKYNSSYYRSSNRPIERSTIFDFIDEKNIKSLFVAMDNIYLRKKLQDKDQEIKDREESIKVLNDNNVLLKYELSCIYNSRRWKASSKMVSIAKKILRKN